MRTKRPGIPKKGPRPAPLALRELHQLRLATMPPAPKAKENPNGLRSRFYAWVRSFAARYMKAGL